MYKACIFDLDGTLADSVESIAYSANRAIVKYGFIPNPVENYKMYAGDGAPEMLKRSLLAAGDTDLEYFPLVQEEYKRLFEKDCMYRVKPYNGIVDALEALKKAGIAIAVLSNKPHDRTVDVVESLFGEGYFDHVLGMKDESTRKPNPAGALAIAEAFGLEPAQCMYVGDTNTDMQTGVAAGMLTIGVTWGFRSREELETNGAQRIIDHPMELPAIAQEN